jgi:hypothetical protein
VSTGDLPDNLAEHLTTEFGDHGQRAVEFLRTAAVLLEADEPAPPRRPECIAHCLREALTTLPELSGLPGGGEWRKLSRAAVDAKLRFEQVRQLPGEDAGRALRDLLDSIDAMESAHAHKSIHQRRLIEVMVARTGVEPLAVGANLISDYQGLIQRSQHALHGAASLETVKVLWDDAVTILHRLFLPPEARHEALTRLAATRDPTHADVDSLMSLLASPNHLHFFLARVSGPEWLKVLEPSGLLDPLPGLAPWPIMAAVGRLVSEHAAWLSGFITRMFEKHRADRDRAWSIAVAARQLGRSGHELLLRAAQKYPTVESFIWLLEDAAVDAEPADPFVQRAADQVINSAMQPGVSVYLRPLLDHYAKGVTTDTYADRIQLLCFKVGRISEDDRHLRNLSFLRSGSITDPPDYGLEDLLPSLLRCLVGAVTAASEFVSVRDLLDAISQLSTVIRSRFRSWILASWGVSDGQLLADEVFQAIGSRPPTGDDVALVDAAVRACGPEEYVGRWSDALGGPPSVTEVGTALASGELPKASRHVVEWAAILPESTTAHWAGPVSIISSAYGGPPNRAALQHRPNLHAVWGSSPISQDQLQAMEPEQAAMSIRSWRPTPDGSMESSRELGRALEAVVKTDSLKWGYAPLRLATLLHEPVYISHYLRGLAGAASLNGLPVGELIDVMMLTTTHPWAPTKLGDPTFDYDPDWGGAVSDSVDLVAELARRDVGFAGRDHEIWDFLLAQAEDRTEGAGSYDGDPLSQAINRPCTRALQAVFSFMGYQFRAEGAVRPAALELLTRSLALPGQDGLQHRAIIASRLAFLRYVAAEWVDAHRDQLFGDRAPDQLAQPTMDLTLTWGQPNTWLLETYPPLVRDAVSRSVDRALDHCMFGMLHGIRGYKVEDVTSHLGATGALSEAAMLLGAELSNEDASTEHAAIAGRFWKYLLDHEPSADMAAGFGWYADISALDDATWSHLTRRTLILTRGRIDRAREVAERASRADPSPDTLEILNQLVRGGGDAWEQHFILEAASATIIRASHLVTESSEYERLHTALLERGAGIPPPNMDTADDKAHDSRDPQPNDSTDAEQ